MNIQKPEFHLQRVYEDGTKRPLEIYKYVPPEAVKFSRRGFLGTGISLASALSALRIGEEKAQAQPGGQKVSAHIGLVSHLFVTPDSSLFASFGGDNKVKLWSLPSGKLLRSLGDLGKDSLFADALLISPDGKLLIGIETNDTLETGVGHRVKVWSLPDGALLRTFYFVNGSWTSAAAVSPDGNLFAVPDTYSIRLYSLTDGTFKTLNGHSDLIGDLAISPASDLLVSSSYDSTIKLWSLPDGRQLRNLTRDDTIFSSGLNISPDGRLLISVTQSVVSESPPRVVLDVWSLPGGAHLARLRGNYARLSTVSFTPDSKLLIAALSNRTLRVWTLPDLNLVTTITTHANLSSTWGSDFLVTPNGENLLLPCNDQTLEVWSLPAVRKLKLEVTMEKDGNKTGQLSWSGTGTLEAAKSVLGPWLPAPSQSNPQTVPLSIDQRFYRLQDDASLPEIRLSRTVNLANSLENSVVTPDGKLLIGSNGGSIGVWNLATAKLLSYAFDKAATSSDSQALTYNVEDVATGQTITYTLPCGSATPNGATCVCNCVPGTYTPPSGGGGGGGGGTICTCIPVFVPIPSDRNIKANFSDVDGHAILERLLKLPVQSWNYTKEQPTVRHIGPMAQDFAAAFGVGDGDRFINAVDAHGVTFAAIQALHRLIESKAEQLKDQRQVSVQLQMKFEALSGQNAELKARLEALEAQVLQRRLKNSRQK